MKRLLVFLLLTAATVASAQQIASYVQNAYTVGPLTNGNAACLSGTTGGIADCGGAPIAVPVSKANGGCGGTTGQACALNLSLPYVLTPLTNDASVTGNGTAFEAALGACNVPANALGTTGDIEVVAEFDGTGATVANFVVVSRFAAGSGTGTGGTAYSSTTTTKGLYSIFRFVIRNSGGATNAQDFFGTLSTAGNGSTLSAAMLHGTSAIDTTAAAVVRVNVSLAIANTSSDTIVLKHMRCTLMQSAGN